MILINLNKISLSYGQDPLLIDAHLQIEAGQRICLIGRNGVGKSTLLKLINQQIEPDNGSIEVSQGTVISILPQTVPSDFTGTVFEKVAEGFGKLGELLSQYERINHALSRQNDSKLLQSQTALQQEIEHQDGWQLHQRVSKTISKISLDPTVEVSTLSGGMKRRVLLAKALVVDPDVLMLDEPTNHLDIQAIDWLEKFLKNYQKTLIFISHDRAFMQAVANQIVELDLGKITSWKGDYQSFLTHKANMLAAEKTQQALFDKKLAEEEAWIRQGIKARRTRNEGRVRALKKMRQERASRQTRQGSAEIESQKHERSGKIVFEAKKIYHSYQDKILIDDFSTTLIRGDKIGIIGPNGCGKTTLIKILLGKLAPKEGNVRLGTKLKTAYFDQHRQQLDPEETVQANAYQGNDMIDFNGKSIHVLSYLKKFLFSPDRARKKVKVLSGGERNRLLLAKLFTIPANVLILDEPTNDLDVETLELLEEMLIEYKGTLLIVSHDRCFLNNVVTSTIVFEGKGRVREYVGGYDDWLRQSNAETIKQEKQKSEKTKKTSKNKIKLTYNEKYELEQLPKRISQIENKINHIQSDMTKKDFYKLEKKEISEKKKQLQDLENELEGAYLRWQALEDKKI